MENTVKHYICHVHTYTVGNKVNFQIVSSLLEKKNIGRRERHWKKHIKPQGSRCNNKEDDDRVNRNAGIDMSKEMEVAVICD